ncbi:hypothetical protein EDB80DRAFT_360879 [Ilyonectria destructans]|nr:hypothetical protein EDB80DRAFT_360879 [Ilyonectria destructans]
MPLPLSLRSEPCAVTDPYTVTEEESLTWLVERHSELEPFDTQRASGVRNSLVSYRQSLINQLRLHEIVGQARRDGLVLIVEAASSSSTFHKIHWEVIEQDELLGHTVLCRRVHDAYDGGHIPNQDILAKRQFYNILMISSRPGVSQDLPYTLLSRPLIDLAERLRRHNGTQVKVVIVRPGCWQAFVNHLEEVTTKNGPGYYDLVHFDVHGDEFRHQVHLRFNPRKVVGQPSPVRISAEAVAKCLHTHGITTVVTNACKSARVGPPLSSFAEMLVRSGIQQVVAMSFDLTAAASAMFVQTFYSHLLAEGSSFIAAAAAARRVLATNRRRLGGLASVEIDDYIVPVVYSSKGKTSIDKPFLRGRPMLEQNDEEQDRSEYGMASRIAEWARSTLGSTFLDNSSLFISDLKGRDADILLLEAQLLSPSTHCAKQPQQFRRPTVMLVHGVAGVGKSAFVRHLCWWWKATQLVQESFYLDADAGYDKNTVRQMLQRVALRLRLQRDAFELGGDLLEPIKDQRYLIVLDSLDSVTQATHAERVRWSEEERTQLLNLVEAVSGTKSILLIVSRSTEPWLGLLDSQRYRLGDLPLALARELLIDRLPAQLQASVSHDDHKFEFRDQLVVLERNPTALDFLLQDLRLSAASPEQLQAIQRIPEIFLFYGLATGRGPCWTSMQIMRTAEFAYERLARLNPDLEVALLSLAFFSTRFRLDWFDYIIDDPGSAVRHFLANGATAKGISEALLVALPAGWIEVDPDYPTKDYPAVNQRSYTYWRIHPLITRVIRARIIKHNRKPREEWPDFALSQIVMLAVYSYFEERTYEWSSNSPAAWRQLKHDVTAENTNFIKTVDIGLLGINMPNDSVVHATYRVLICLAAFCLLENVDKELIIRRCELFVQTFGTTEGGEVEQLELPRLEYVLHVLNSLCMYYAESFPQTARKYSDMMLNLFNASNEHVRTDTTVYGLKCQAEFIKGHTLLLLGYYGEGKALLTDLLEKLIADDTLPLNLRSPVKISCLLVLLGKSLAPLESELRIWNQQLKETSEELKSVSNTPAHERLVKRRQQEILGRIVPDTSLKLSKDPRKTFHNSFFLDHGCISVIPDVEIVQALLQDSRVHDAKSHLLERLADSIANGDKPAQIVYYRLLIDFALQLGSDAAAAEYMERLVLLEDRTAGFWGREDRGRNTIRYSRYALCLVRLRRFDAAGPLLLKAFGNSGTMMTAMSAAGLGDLVKDLKKKVMASLFAPHPDTLTMEAWFTSEIEQGAVWLADAVAARQVDHDAFNRVLAFSEPLHDFDSLTADQKKDLFRWCLGYQLGLGTLTKKEHWELTNAMIDWCTCMDNGLLDEEGALGVD